MVLQKIPPGSNRKLFRLETLKGKEKFENGGINKKKLLNWVLNGMLRKAPADYLSG
jgi:hypothetical protein